MADPLEEKSGVYALVTEIEGLIAALDACTARIKTKLDRLVREHQNFYEGNKDEQRTQAHD